MRWLLGNARSAELAAESTHTPGLSRARWKTYFHANADLPKLVSRGANRTIVSARLWPQSDLWPDGPRSPRRCYFEAPTETACNYAQRQGRRRMEARGSSKPNSL